MRIRLLLADVFAILLGLFGFVATYSLMALDCSCSAMNYIGAMILFVPATVFLLPSAHETVLRWSFSWLTRIPFFLVAAGWSFMCAAMLLILKDTPIPFPGWSFLSSNAGVIWLVMMVLLIFNHLLPGASYDLLREKKAVIENGDHEYRATRIPPTASSTEQHPPSDLLKRDEKRRFALNKKILPYLLLLTAPITFLMFGHLYMPTIPSIVYAEIYAERAFYAFVAGFVLSLCVLVEIRIFDASGQPTKLPARWYLMRSPLALLGGVVVWFASFSAIPVAANIVLSGEQYEATYTIKDISYDNRCTHQTEVYVTDVKSLWDSYEFCLKDHALAKRLSTGDQIKITGKKTWFGQSVDRVEHHSD